jgi:heme/copper-type cytochrome/quinol oxidase subunit 1
MIDWFVTWFLKGSLSWLAASVLVGVAMALAPTLTVYRTAHMHMALLGFVTQMIYGVALHVIPRFFGQPLVHRRLAEWQFWFAQAGLFGMVAGFVARIQGGVGAAAWLLGVGGSLSAIAAGCFVVGIWRTMDASPMRKVNRSGRPLTTLPQADAH